MAKYRFEEIVYNSTEKKKPVEEDRFTYIGLEHLDPGTLNVTRYGSDVAPIGEKLIMKEGDVLFGKRRAYQKKVAIAPFDGIFSAHGMVLRPKEDVVDKVFFPLYISSDYFLDAAIKISVGSLSPTINWSDLKNLEFELPTLEEQRKLANALIAINTTRDGYRKLINATEQLIKSQFMEQFGHIEANPYGWDRAILTDVCDFQGGSQPPKKDWISGPKDGYVRMLQIRDFTQEGKYSPEYVKITNAIKTCDYEDVLIGRYGASVCKILTGQAGAYNVAIMRSIPQLSKINRVYLKQYFLIPYFQDYILAIASGRGAQAGFNKEDLSRREILLPPLVIQEQFEAFVRQSDKSKFVLQVGEINIDDVIKNGGKIKCLMKTTRLNRWY
jgi:type I restriction enzyme S subunit